MAKVISSAISLHHSVKQIHVVTIEVCVGNLTTSLCGLCNFSFFGTVSHMHKIEVLLIVLLGCGYVYYKMYSM